MTITTGKKVYELAKEGVTLLGELSVQAGYRILERFPNLPTMLAKQLAYPKLGPMMVGIVKTIEKIIIRLK